MAKKEKKLATPWFTNRDVIYHKHNDLIVVL